MAYPTTITPINTASAGYSIDPSRNDLYPILYGTAMYQVAQGQNFFTFNYFVTVFKSTDHGITWTEMDTANVPLDALNPENMAVLSQEVQGSIIYVTHSYPLCIDQFDMSTDTWGTQVASGGPEVHRCVTLAAGRASIAKAFKRNDGTFAVVYQALSDTFGGNSYGRVKYSFWNGATWTAGASFTGLGIGDKDSEGLQSAILINDRVHAFFSIFFDIGGGVTRPPRFVYDNYLCHCSIDNADAIDTYDGVGVELRFSGTGPPYEYVSRPAAIGTTGYVSFIWTSQNPGSGIEVFSVSVADFISQANPVFNLTVIPQASRHQAGPTNDPHFPYQGVVSGLWLIPCFVVAPTCVSISTQPVSGIGAVDIGYVEASAPAPIISVFVMIPDNYDVTKGKGVWYSSLAAGVWSNPVDLYLSPLGAPYEMNQFGVGKAICVTPPSTGGGRFAGIGIPGAISGRGAGRIRLAGVGVT